MMSIFDAKTKTAVFVRSVGITSPFDILLYSPVVYYATMHAMVGVPLGWCLIVVMLNFFASVEKSSFVRLNVMFV